MNWFVRHLNWASVIILFTSIALAFLLGLTSLGFHAFPNAVDLDSLLINNVLIVVFGCFLLAVIGFGWILKQKKRSLFFLFFFIPLISPLLLILFRPEFSDYAINVLILLPIGLSIVGLVLLLRLRNLSPEEKSIVTPSTQTIPFFSPKWCTGHSKLHNAIFISISVILVFLVSFTGYSYYGMEHSYRTYTGKLITGDLNYTFEYPRSYYVPFLFDWKYIGDVAVAGLNRITWFKEDSWIHIRVWYASVFESVQDQTPENKDITILSRTLGGLFDENPPTADLKVTATSVDGTPADYITLVVLKRPQQYYAWGTLRAVCFESRGYIWVISIFYPNRTTPQPSAPFEHLIQTFKIMD